MTGHHDAAEDYTRKDGLVVGGTTGIGVGIAEKFPKHGANVSGAGRKRKTIDDAVAALATAGGNIVGHSGRTRL